MMNARHTLCWTLLFVALLESVAFAQPDPDYALRIEQKCAVGSEVVTQILMDNNGITVSGWSFGVCHDGAALNLLEVLNGETTTTVNNGAPPAFNGVNVTPAGGSGYTVGAVVDLANNFSLPTGMDFELYESSYEYINAPGGASPIDFCETLGSPVVNILITLTTITGVDPVTEGETVLPLGCFCEDVNTYTGRSVSFEEATPGPLDAGANAVFAPLGVVLTSLSGNVEVIQGNLALAAVSPPQLLGNPTGITLTDGVVEIDFVVPATGENGSVTQASFALVSDGLGMATVTAFNAGGSVVFSNNVSGVPDGREMVQIFAPDIDRIEVNLDASGSRFGLDDLCFDEPIVVLEPPIIDVNPVGGTICEGDSTTLSVVAMGPPPLTYQWLLDGVEIMGATGTSLLIDNAATADGGSYTVAVTNMDGTTESVPAVVNVVAFPVITQEPQSVAVCAGDPAVFTVVATGDNLTYEWFFGAIQLPETSDTLTIPMATAQFVGDFHVEVSSGDCATQSMPASLSLLTELSIDVSPADATLCSGDPLSLSVLASGDGPFTYQWRIDGVDIMDATESTFDVPATVTDDSGSYDCVVTGPCTSATSDPATVTVITRPTFTMDPASQIICTGDAVTLTVTTDPVAGVTYQWLLNGVDIMGATGPSYTIPAASALDAGLYSVVASLGSCMATSAEAMLSVVDPVVIVMSPAGADLCVGDALSLAVTATGDDPLTYQWNLDGAPIGGATEATYMVAAVDLSHGGSYDCLVSNACSSQMTVAVTVTVSPFPAFTTDLLPMTACIGDAVSMTVVTDPPATDYQWFLDNVEIAGATAATYDVPVADATHAGTYRVDASIADCLVASSDALLTLLEPVTITTDPAAADLCVGDDATLTVAATGSPALTYEWRKDGNPLAGEFNDTLQLTGVEASDAGSYDCLVTNACGSVASAAAAVTVTPIPQVATSTGDLEACVGDLVTMTVTTDPATGVSFVWNFEGTPIVGATTATLAIPAAQLADAGAYSVTLSIGDCESTTPVGTLTVLEPVVVTLQPSDATVCEGDPVTLTVAATGTAPITYQWQLDGSDVPGAMAETLSIPSAGVADSGTYTCLVTNSCGTVSSAGALVTVIAFPTITSDLQDTTGCLGQAVTLSVVSDPAVGVVYQWFLNGTEIVGATAADYTIDPATPADAGMYHVTVSAGACVTTSATATLTLQAPVSIDVQPVGVNLCSGDPLSLSVAASGEMPLSYQWHLDGNPIVGALSESYSIPAADVVDSGSYTCVVSNRCGDLTSDPAVVAVTGLPGIVTDLVDTTGCLGEMITLSIVSDPAVGVDYQWFLNGTEIVGANAADYTIDPATLADAGMYHVAVSAGTCVTTSATATLTLQTPVSIDVQPVGVNLCSGDPLSLSIAASGELPLTYQWHLDGNPIGGATSDTYDVAAAQVGDSGSYTCVVSNRCGDMTSDAAIVAVTGLPVIVTDLVDTTGCLGEVITLSIVSDPAVGVDYQWFLNGTEIVGATAADYTIDPATLADAGMYHVTVSAGTCVTTSATATLTLQAPVSIDVQPVGVNLCGGDPLSLSVVASGEPPLTYQWHLDGNPIGGATSDTYDVAAAQVGDSGSYTCVVSNRCGDMTSDAAIVAVTGLPVIVTDLVDTTGCLGEVTTLSIVSDPAVGVDYQWFLNGTEIVGATAADYTIDPATLADAGMYHVTVSAGTCVTTSATATLTLQAPVSIDVQPVGVNLCSGDPLSLSVAASGEPPLTYQWHLDGNPIGGATSDTYDVAAAQVGDSGSYTCVVSNRCGDMTSDAAVVAVTGLPVIVTDLVDTTGCLGEVITLSIVSNPAVGVDYQWFLNGTEIVGATAADYTIDPATLADAGMYHVTVSAGTCVTTSATATLTLQAPVSIDVQPVGVNLCSGDPLSLSVVASGEPPLTYQWHLDGTPIGGATTDTYDVAAAQVGDSGSYTCVVSNRCGDVTSDPAVVSVTGLPVIVTDLVDTTGCLGEVITLSIVSDPAVGVDYQWFLNGTEIVGATATDYTIDPATLADAGVYHVTVSAGTCVTTSTMATLTLQAPVSIDVQPVGVNLCSGDPLSLSVAASGELPLTYQWHLDGNPIGGATSDTYDVAAAQVGDSGSYTCVVSNPCGDMTSDPAVVSVTGLPVIVTDLVDTTGCLGEVITLSIVSDPAVGVDYQWFLNGTEIVGATTADYTIDPATLADAGMYHVTVSAGTCVTTSATATLTLQAPVSIDVQPVGVNLCSGDPLSLSVVASGEPPLTYQWHLDGTPIGGATTDTYDVAAAQVGDSGSYTCVVSNRCGDVTSDPAVVSVTGLPVIVTDLVDTTGCLGEVITLSIVSDPAVGVDYQWFLNGTEIVGATTADYTIDPATLADAGMYHVTVSAGSCVTTSATATLTLQAPVSIGVQPVGVNLCSGDPLSLSVVASGEAPLTYQWHLDGNPIGGATSDTYDVAAVQVGDSGSYTCVVSNRCGDVTSDPAVVSVIGLPVITADLVDTTGCLGETITLSVVSDPAVGVDYQWFLDGTEIAGATTADYTIDPATLADAGIYHVTVSAGSCVTTSATATLTLQAPVVIDTHPADTTLCSGDPLSLTVAATGEPPLTYQWRLDGNPINNATTSSYTVLASQVSDSGAYDCVVSNRCGDVISNVATVVVTGVPVITTDLQDLISCIGSTVTLGIVTNPATGLDYQWFKDGVLIPGETSAQYVIPSATTDDIGSYSVTVSAGSCSVQSATATLALLNPVSITGQPAGVNLCSGDPLSLNVAASGSGTLTYQWRLDGVPIPAATASSYNVPATTPADSGSYDVVVTNSCGSVKSAVAVVNVTAFPTITMDLLDLVSCIGAPVTLGVVTNPATGLDFQWFKDGTRIAGATGSTYVIASAIADDAGDYQVQISAGSCVINSAVATLALLTPVTITTQPVGADLCEGDPLSLGVAATGSATVTYQWRLDGVDIVGATMNSYNVLATVVNDGGVYDCVVTNSCGSVTTDPVTVSVTAFPVIVTEPLTQNGCVGTPVTLSVVTDPAMGVAYQWFLNGVAIVGATADSYEITSPVLGDAGDYTVEISAASCSVTSATATLTLDEPVLITSDPVGTGVCVGDPLSLSVVASGTAPLTYQWQLDGNPIVGATGSSYDVLAAQLTDGGTYDVVVTNPCGSVTSAPALVAVVMAPTIVQEPQTTEGCFGQPLTLSVVADPAVGVDYQWFLNGAEIPGATMADYMVAAASAADLGDYHVEISLGSCQTTSMTATVTLIDPVVITMDPEYADVCIGDGFSLSVMATGTAPLTYQWQKDGVDVVGATLSSFNVLSAGPADGGNYVCLVTNSCGTVASNVSSVTVTEYPVISTQPASQLACVGDSVTLEVVATPATVVYQWLLDGVEIMGANSATYMIPAVALTDAGDYSVIVASGVCSVTSDVATLTVDEAVVITVEPEATTDLCVGDSATLSVTATGTPPLSYQWRLEGVDLVGETNATLDVTASAAGSSNYDCVVSNACSSATTAVAVVNEHEPAVITQSPTAQTVCVGDPVTLTVVATGTDLAYQWQFGGVDLSGETAATLTFTADLSSAGDYACVVTSGVCPGVLSASALVTVNEPVTITMGPSGDTICEGFAFGLAVMATGTPPLSYQWALDGAPIAGATLATLDIAAVSPADAGNYTVTVTNICGSEESAPATLTVTPAAECDCNGNLVLDSEEIATGAAEDCNSNGIPDSCDIASGVSADTDMNGIPDECEETQFMRGDCISDGSLNILDATMALDFLFGTNIPPILECLNACDANDDDNFDIADAVFTLNALFVQVVPIPDPFLVCGIDPTPGVLTCDVYNSCP